MSAHSSAGVLPGEHPLVGVLGFACLGVACDRQLAIAPWVWCAGLLGAMALWCVVRRRHERGAAILVLLCVAALAGLWHHDRWRLFAADEIGRYAADEPAPVCVRVVALEPPRWRPAEQPGALSTMVRGEMTRMAVRLVAMRQGACWQPVSGRVTLLADGSLTGLLRGDLLEVAGTLVRVRAAANPGEPNVAAIGRRSRQLATLHCGHAACVKRLAQGGPWSVLRQLGRLRVWAERVLDRHIAPPQAALAAALLLGCRERLDRETVDEFFVSGTVHLLSISGSHVAILASVMWVIIRLDWFPRRRMLLLTCGLAIAYALLTGAQPPVVRATVLIVVYCLARWTNRRAVAWNSLSAAGLITLGLSPGGMYDVGTQLSYLAVAVLIAHRPLRRAPRGTDPLRRLVEESRPGWLRAARRFGGGVWQVAVASTWIWLVSMPLVANRFHLVPLLGVPANLLLWLPIPMALLSGLAVLILSPVPVLAAAAGWFCGQSLVVTRWLMSISAAPTWGHCWMAGPPGWLVGVFYLFLAVYQFRVVRLPARWWLALLAAWLTVNIGCSATAARVGRMLWGQPLRYSFVAVGHGTSVLVELPDGAAILYDAGRLGDSHSAVLPISSVLWSRRITHLDALVLSHADVDHFNAVPELLDRFSVGVVYVSPVMLARPSAAVRVLEAALDASRVPVRYLSEGDQCAGRGCVEVDVLHPPPGGCGGGDNSNSLVLGIAVGSQRALLTGDLEAEGLEELLAEPPQQYDLLLAPHHGSRRSRPREMARWAAPRVVVVSEGAARDGASFLADWEATGASVYWTHQHGMVEVLVAGRELRVRTWRPSGPKESAQVARELSR